MAKVVRPVRQKSTEYGEIYKFPRAKSRFMNSIYEKNTKNRVGELSNFEDTILLEPIKSKLKPVEVIRKS